MNCKNCDAVLDSKFCPGCGQKAETHRLTIGHIVHEFFHLLTHAEMGIFYLVKKLLVRPGFVAKEYVEGKRKKYTNPISFLLVTTAVGAFISFKSGYYQALSRPMAGQGNPSPYFTETMEISINHGKILGLFLIVPLYSFLSWIFFWRPRYNFAENFVLQSYLIGMLYIVTSLIFIPHFLIFPAWVKVNNDVLHVLFAIYMGIAYRQFFGKHIVISILKSFIMTVLFIVLFWVVILLYVIVKRSLFGH
jgi:hypothetical protein